MVNVIASVLGAIYLLLAVLGFLLIPSGGLLLGIFALNPFHHVFHFALSALAIVAARTGRGRLYCQVTGLVLLLLTLLGFMAPTFAVRLMADPSADILTDNLLHLVTGIPLVYFGFLPHPETVPMQTQPSELSRK